MLVEVLCAVDFICGLLRHQAEAGTPTGDKAAVPNFGDKMSMFRRKLDDRLRDHYRGHWHPNAPERGSAYRCIRVGHRQVDPVIAAAGREAGLTERELLAKLPADLTLWVDPDEVCVRFGEDGSVGVIYLSSKNEGSDSDPDDSMASSTGYNSEVDSDRASPETVLLNIHDLRPVVMPTS